MKANEGLGMIVVAAERFLDGQAWVARSRGEGAWPVGTRCWPPGDSQWKCTAPSVPARIYGRPPYFRESSNFSVGGLLQSLNWSTCGRSSAVPSNQVAISNPTRGTSMITATPLACFSAVERPHERLRHRRPAPLRGHDPPFRFVCNLTKSDMRLKQLSF